MRRMAYLAALLPFMSPVDVGQAQPAEVAPIESRESDAERKVKVMTALGDDLCDIEHRYGSGTVKRLLLHMAQQLNLAATQPMTDAEHRKAFPPAEYPRLYDRDGNIKPEEKAA